MDIDSWIDQLEADGALLAAAAGRAGWDATVPATDWDVRALVTHTGGVHRWAADSIRTHAPGFGTSADGAIGTGPGDDELLDWFRAGHEALVALLRAVADDVDVFTFLPAPNPRSFWCRRQAHETAIHRADAQAAAGLPVTPFAADFAQDGIAELVGGFAARGTSMPAATVTLRLDTSDAPDARIRIEDGRVSHDPASESASSEATVRGTSSQLYLWLWNRPSGATVHGDHAAAELWRQVRIT